MIINPHFPIRIHPDGIPYMIFGNYDPIRDAIQSGRAYLICHIHNGPSVVIHDIRRAKPEYRIWSNHRPAVSQQELTIIFGKRNSNSV